MRGSALSAPAFTLFDLITAHRITAVLHAAAKLGVADVLAEGARDSAALAAASGAHEPSLRRLLDALVTLGVCRLEDRHYALTDVGLHLSASSPHSLKAWAIFEGEMLRNSWTGLLDSVRSGRTVDELAGATDRFALMARDPQSVDTFNAAMRDLARLVTPAVLRAYDFSRFTRLIDVGGGTGELLTGILQAYPSLQGAVLDLAGCREDAAKRFAGAGLGERAAFIAGDFFRSIPPGADALILKSVVHDWDDSRSVHLLKNCRAALPGHGTLILVERLMPDTLADDAEHRAIMLGDLNMLRGPGGRERSEAEYRSLLDDSGLRTTRVLRAGRFNLIEAAPI